MLFTIATVTKNNVQGIEKTWNSIKTQSFKNFEWLVQDGVSTDNTQDFLKNTNAHTVSEPDKGIYDGMNKLVKRAKGRYIIFMNAGDMLAASDTLQTIADAIDNQSSEFIYGDAFEEVQNKHYYKTARPHSKIKYGMPTHHQAMLYKTSTLKETHYNETYTIAADYELTARVINASQNITYIPKPLCIFEAGGTSQKNVKLGRNEQFQIRKNLKLCCAFENHLITNLQKLNFAFRKAFPPLYWLLKRR